MRGEELAVAAPARPSRRDGDRCDGLTTTAAAAVAAGRCWSCLSARAVSLPRSRMTNLSTVCPIRPVYEPVLIARRLGVALEAVRLTRLRCKVIAYMKNRVSIIPTYQ